VVEVDAKFVLPQQVEQSRADKVRWSALENPFGVPDRQPGQMLTAVTDFVQDVRIKQPVPAVTGQKADVLESYSWGLVHHRIRPAPGLDDRARLGAQQHDPRLLHPLASNNIDDHRAGLGVPEVVGNVPA
jgi:hypothetical protein